METEPPAPSKYDRRLAGDLDLIALKALRKDRRERFQSVEQFAHYIRLFLNDLPLPERAPGLLYKSRKFLKRNRVPLAAAGLLLATLLGGLLATQRQARIAQRRFEDVRRLATSFLFEFDGAIANVSGATPARRLVVAKGLEYLAKLAQDAGADDALKEELASGYERLAGIQGNVYGSNLGEYQLAAEIYERALAIRKDLSARHPGDVALRRGLGNSHLQLADGWFTKGDTKAAVAQYRQGLEILEGLSAEGDSSKAVQTGMQRGYSRLCNFLLPAGDHRGAIENCEKSARLTNALVAGNPSDVSLRAALAAAYGQMGNVLRFDKRPKEAISQLALSAGEFEKLRAAQPDNNGFARNLAGVYAVMGATQTALGDTKSAIDSFKRSIETARSMLRLDPADARAKTTLAVSLLRVTPVLQQAGRLTEAKAAGAEGLTIFRRFADRPQATPDDLNNYASFLSEISVPELKNPREVLAYSLRAVAPVKEPSLVFLSTLVDAYSGVDDIDGAIATAKKALASNPKAEGSGEAGLRASLERKLKMLEDTRAQKAGPALRSAQ
jgi:tetratricopeptide (TPR) repeat protein